MKIIENNNQPEQTSWKSVCPHCNSILEYDKSDVNIKESRFFYLHWIVCPCCKHDVDVQHW